MAKNDPLRGRKSLSGLDPMGWAASVDAVGEGRVTCPAALLPNFEDGTVDRRRSVFELTLDARDELRPVEGDYGDDYTAYTKAISSWLQSRHRIAWVRVLRARKGQIEDLERHFPTFAARVATGAGRAKIGTRNMRVPLFRATDVFAVFAAVWPDNWHTFAPKYLRGYTLAAAEEIEWVDYTDSAPIPGWQGPGYYNPQ